MSVAPVPHSHHDLVDPVLFDQTAQCFAVTEYFGLVRVCLPIPALYETDEVETSARTESDQQGIDFGRPGPAPDYEDPALQRVVSDNPKEHRSRKHSEQKGKQQAQGHDASTQS